MCCVAYKLDSRIRLPRLLEHILLVKYQKPNYRGDFERQIFEGSKKMVMLIPKPRKKRGNLGDKQKQKPIQRPKKAKQLGY